MRCGAAPLMGGAAKPCMGGVGEVEGWGKTEEEEEAQPSILTLKNGRPGAFNDPCVSDTGEGADDTGYRSPQYTHKQHPYLCQHFFPFVSHIKQNNFYYYS